MSRIMLIRVQKSKSFYLDREYILKAWMSVTLDSLWKQAVFRKVDIVHREDFLELGE